VFSNFFVSKVSQICTGVHPVLHVTLAKEDSSRMLIFRANNVLLTIEPENGRLKRSEQVCVRSQIVCQVSPDNFFLGDVLGSSSFCVGKEPQPLSVKGSISAQMVDEFQVYFGNKLRLRNV